MDYNRKELVDWVRGIYQNLDEADKQDALRFFPELRESEDEIHRKWILEYLYDGLRKADEQFKDHFKSAIDWFEKQKEQKPAHTAKEMWKEMRLEVYAQASGNRHEPNYSDDSTKMFSLCDIDEIFEKIGNSTVGSRPAEWSEEDEAYRKSIISTIEMCMKDCERANVVLGCYESDIAWLKRLRPSWKPSDEQMNVLRLEIGYLESRPGEHSIAVEMLCDLYNDLKNL